MSRWAAFYFTVFQNLKHILNTFFSYFELGRLATLFIIAITLTLFIADNNAIADKLFQSPASPPAQPTPTQPPPTEQPPAEPPPAEPPPAEQPPAQPPVEPAESVPEFESPVPEPLPEGGEPPPFVQPTVETRADDFFEEESSFSDEDEEASSSNFIWDWAELIDSVVVSSAYVWLCCGVVLLLLIPLFFLFLQIRGQIKIQREEDF